MSAAGTTLGQSLKSLYSKTWLLTLKMTLMIFIGVQKGEQTCHPILIDERIQTGAWETIFKMKSTEYLHWKEHNDLYTVVKRLFLREYVLFLIILDYDKGNHVHLFPFTTLTTHHPFASCHPFFFHSTLTSICFFLPSFFPSLLALSISCLLFHPLPLWSASLQDLFPLQSYHLTLMRVLIIYTEEERDITQWHRILCLQKE